VDQHCAQLQREGIPFYKCPSGIQKCITLDLIRDNKPDCEHGEDEGSSKKVLSLAFLMIKYFADPNRHQVCDAQQKAQHCQANAQECTAVEKGQKYFCRCKKGEKASCNSKHSLFLIEESFINFLF
jgi:hypothetical protein